MARPRNARQFIRMAGGMLAGALVGGAVAVIALNLIGKASFAPPAVANLRTIYRWLWLPAIVLIWLVVVGTHELGHMLAGRFAGYRLLAFYLGPIQIYRDGNRLRVGLNRQGRFFGGACLSAPEGWKGIEAFRRHYWWFAAGGPLASLVLGLGGFALFRVLRGPAPGSPVGVWAPPLILTSMTSIGIGLATLIPATAGGITSDGFKLLRFRKPNPQRGRPLHAEVPFSALMLTALTSRPRDWDPALVELAAAIPEDYRLKTSVQSLLYYRTLDRHDLPAAHALLQQLVNAAWASTAHTAKHGRASLALEAATFEAAWRGDAEAARRWLQSTSRTTARDPLGHELSAAAVAAAQGDRAEARRLLERAVANRDALAATLLRAATIERLRDVTR